LRIFHHILSLFQIHRISLPTAQYYLSVAEADLANVDSDNGALVSGRALVRTLESPANKLNSIVFDHVHISGNVKNKPAQSHSLS
jgi:hypothetical protein